MGRSQLRFARFTLRTIKIRATQNTGYIIVNNASHPEFLSKLTVDELLDLAQAIQTESARQHEPPKSIFAELEALAKQAGISTKELDFLT